MCRSMIQKHGVEHVRLEQMISEVGPKARQSVPEQVRTEILDAIKKQMRPATVEKEQQLPLQKQTIVESNDDSFVL